jgi:hypothetical protein
MQKAKSLDDRTFVRGKDARFGGNDEQKPKAASVSGKKWPIAATSKL